MTSEHKLQTITYIELENTNYKIWTNKIGSGSIKLLVLSGGPGLSHDYLCSFIKYLPLDHFTIYFYDQLGTGRSNPELSDASLWTLERYLKELEQVVKCLQLENFIIYGHSWGAILAIEYALKYPKKLRGLIISNMTASIESYLVSYRKFREYLTPEKLALLEECEKNNDFDSDTYQELLGEIMQYTCMIPLPDYAINCLTNMNRSVYNTMLGKNEFFPDGNLINWNRWNDLKNINVKTLIIIGKKDMMSVSDADKMFNLIPNVKLTIYEYSAHVPMIDNPKAYFTTICDFCEIFD